MSYFLRNGLNVNAFLNLVSNEGVAEAVERMVIKADRIAELSKLGA